jgi:hypothetical protein
MRAVCDKQCGSCALHDQPCAVSHATSFSIVTADNEPAKAEAA